MNTRAFLRPLWRTLGGVLGVVALLGLAYGIGWVHERVIGLPQA